MLVQVGNGHYRRNAFQSDEEIGPAALSQDRSGAIQRWLLDMNANSLKKSLKAFITALTHVHAAFRIVLPGPSLELREGPGENKSDCYSEAVKLAK
jgi:hypothetical protein